MRANNFVETQLDHIQITAVSDRNAKGLTPYNAEITVGWTYNLPNPIPQIGEWWTIERSNTSDWSFVSRMTSGQYNAMYYSLRLDSETCIGREREVVDDIKNIGVTCVYLTVASNGQVYWDSDCAHKIGYTVNGNRIEQVVRRLEDYNIAIVFVIDFDSLPIGGEYTQQGYGSASQNGLMSIPKCKDIVAQMVFELYTMYGSIAKGVCFDGVQVPFGHDVSIQAESEYLKQYGELPNYDVVFNPSSPDWYAAWSRWMEFWHGQYGELLFAVQRSGIGYWPVSATVPSNTLFRAESTKRTGDIDTGVGIMFGEIGWANIGVPLAFTMQQNQAAELRSLEMCISMMKRFSGNSSTIYELDIRRIKQPDGIFSMLAKYDATNILLDSYEHWRLLSDDEVIHIKEAMNIYSVTEKSTLDDVGIVLSQRSRDIDYASVATNHRWFDGLENIAGVMLDNLPHKLRILYDTDLSTDRPNGLSAMMYYLPSRLTPDVVEQTADFINRDGLNVVLAGVAQDESGDVILLDKFGQATNSRTVYFNLISVRKDGFAAGVEDYYIEDGVGVVGILPALSPGEVYGYHGNRPQALSGLELAPVFFNGRSSVIAMDISQSGVLQELVGRLVLYAIGRDGVE